MAVKQEQWKMKGKKWLGAFIRRRIPILAWLPSYNSEKFISDAIAGITVGLTVMPQGLAYATLAGLEPQVIFHLFFIFYFIFYFLF